MGTIKIQIPEDGNPRLIKITDKNGRDVLSDMQKQGIGVQSIDIKIDCSKQATVSFKGIITKQCSIEFDSDIGEVNLTDLLAEIEKENEKCDRNDSL